MTQEQLMKPRWKVIAAFPDNRNYEVGSILDRDWCRYVNDEDESEGIVWKISDFPHLFKKLEWWEEREEKDMPEYVKINFKPHKVKSWQKNVIDEWYPLNDSNVNMEWHFFKNKSLPITREEYEQYIQSKK